MNIVLGITGSIAAYKSAVLVRLLRRRGDEVQVVMTPAGKNFITPVTLAALSGRGVASEFFENADGTWHSHVDLGRWADVMLVAPATASTIGKMAAGVADNLLVTTYLAMKAPVVVAPAMDLDMYAHPSTQENLATLRRRGVHVIEPRSGALASGLEGKGRLPEPEEIVEALDEVMSSELLGYQVMPSGSGGGASANNLITSKLRTNNSHVLITAGPTREPLDEVRFIANRSTGKMGFALAEACARRGWQVSLVCGPVDLTISHPLIRRYDVETAEEMYERCMEIFPTCTDAILCAAVADFTLEHPAEGKMKRGDGELLLRLRPTRDIAAALGAAKRADQRLIAFALEADEGLRSAKEKMQRKGADAIVLNSLRDEGAGFACDTNKITILSADGTQQAFPLKTKREAAEDVVDWLMKL